MTKMYKSFVTDLEERLEQSETQVNHLNMVNGLCADDIEDLEKALFEAKRKARPWPWWIRWLLG